MDTQTSSEKVPHHFAYLAYCPICLFLDKRQIAAHDAVGTRLHCRTHALFLRNLIRLVKMSLK